MNVITVLKYGTVVRLESVDMFSFCGRDNHPKPTDLGFLGTVVGNWVETYDADGDPLTSRENVLGGTEFVDDEDYSLASVCYKVRSPDGRMLDLMDHEVEPV